MAKLTKLIALAVAVLLLGASTPAHGQESLRLAEQAIKAGLVYNFLHYTRWPPNAQSNGPILVCVYDQTPLGGRLDPIARRTINQRRIELRRLNAAGESGGCTMIFLGAEERARWPQIRDALGARDVLTVGDFAGFAASGGMVEFTRTDEHVGVRINVGALSRAGLSMQDRLLALAETTS